MNDTTGRNILRLVHALTAVGARCGAAAAVAQSTNSRFEPAQIPARPAGSVVPHSLDQTEIKVVAILSGPSVANEQEAAGRRLTRAERAAVKAQRDAEQSGVRPQIEAS